MRAFIRHLLPIATVVVLPAIDAPAPSLERARRLGPIRAETLSRLRHPSRPQKLRDYLVETNRAGRWQSNSGAALRQEWFAIPQNLVWFLIYRAVVLDALR
jgi:hypothetical protein